MLMSIVSVGSSGLSAGKEFLKKNLTLKEKLCGQICKIKGDKAIWKM